MPDTPAQIEAMLTAIYNTLRLDDELSELAPGGVHQIREHRQDVTTADDAFVTFRVRPGGMTYATLGNARAMQDVMVEVVGTSPGAGDFVVHRIEERIDALLSDNRLTLASPWTCGGCRRVMPLDLSTTDQGAEIDRRGGLYRVSLSKE